MLVAHGAPERLQDVPEFLASVLGAPAPPALVAEVSARYERIGGASPLNAVSRRQAQALVGRLGVPVFLALRHWHPTIPETLAEAQAAGYQRFVALSASPQFSPPAPLAIPWAPSVHRHPLFVEAMAEKLTPLVEGRKVLFTAHSLPARLAASAEWFEREARATAAAVAGRCGLAAFEFAFQSQGRSAGDWLGPTVESRIEVMAARRVRDVVVVPLSYTAENLEVLYDVDIQLRQYALERGVSLRRSEAPGDSDLFIEALAATVRPLLEALA